MNYMQHISSIWELAATDPTPEEDIAEAPDKAKKSQAEVFIDDIAPVLCTIAGTNSVKFEASEEGSYFNHEKGVIALQMLEGTTYDQGIFVACHEVGHLTELMENSTAYLGNFEYLGIRSKELARLATNILKAEGIYDVRWDEAIIDEETGKSWTRMELLMYEELHLLLNCIDDIAVNRKIGLKVPMFSKNGSKVRQVNTLYSETLFPEHDLTDLPLHRQLAYAMLLGHMTEDKYQISPQIHSVLNGHADQLALQKDFTYFNEVSLVTNPGRLGGKDNGYRSSIVRTKIEPAYVDLLLEAIKKIQVPAPPEESSQGEGQGKGGQGNTPWNPWGKPKGGLGNNPTDAKNARQAKIFKNGLDKKKQEEKDRKEDGRATPQQRATNARAAADRAICEKYDIDPSVAADYREVEKKVEKYKEQLADVFDRFMRTIDEKIKVFYIEGCRSGKFNVNSFIKKYGDQVDMDAENKIIPWDRLDVYDRQEFVSRMSLQPSEIFFRLILDVSGSMVGERIDKVKQMMVLFMEALTTFEARVNLRFRLKEDFKVSTEIRKFNDKTEIIKPFSTGKNNPDQEIADRLRAFKEIYLEGRTNDYNPLNETYKSLSPDRIKDLASRKAMEMCILITDGGSDTPDSSKEEVLKLASSKVLATGLQIGDPNEDEKRTFNFIWGDRGLHVDSLDDLAPTLINLFDTFLNELPPTISFYEIDESDEE